MQTTFNEHLPWSHRLETGPAECAERLNILTLKVLSIQNKTNHNDNYDKYVCLSSGYDSGAICTALNQLKKKFHTYTIIATENIDIVNRDRFIFCKNTFTF